MFKRGTCIDVICTHLVPLQRRSCSFSRSRSFFFFFSFCTYSCHKRCLRKRKIVRELKMTWLNTKKMSVILRRSLNWVSIMVNIPVRLSSLMWVETFRHVTSAQQKRRERAREEENRLTYLTIDRAAVCLRDQNRVDGLFVSMQIVVMNHLDLHHSISSPWLFLHWTSETRMISSTALILFQSVQVAFFVQVEN